MGLPRFRQTALRLRMDGARDTTCPFGDCWVLFPLKSNGARVFGQPKTG